MLKGEIRKFVKQFISFFIFQTNKIFLFNTFRENKCRQMSLIQPESELDIGSRYVTYLPTPPYLPTLPTHPELSVLLLFKLDH